MYNNGLRTAVNEIRITTTMHELIELIENFGSPKVALVGDFLLDKYVYGDVERISPEAPVPILNVVDSESRVGGAGNVAATVLAMGGQVSCIGVIGDDVAGAELTSLLRTAGAETESLITQGERPTIVKSRYVGLAQHRHRQQMFRVDTEDARAVCDEVHDKLAKAIEDQLSDCSVLALEDYDKGVLGERTPELIALAAKAGVPVVVDPARIKDYSRYKGATLLTPNRYEAQLASGIQITDDKTLLAAAQRIIEVTNAAAIMITVDKEGIFLLTRGGEPRRIPTRPRSVYDVTGAGDAVLAALSVAVAEKVDLADAAAIANIAGGLEVERFGVVPISRNDLVDELRRMIGLRGAKVMDRPKLVEELARRKARGEKIVFTNGCFDLLHIGHVSYLRQARELGNCLVVAINSDDSAKRLKGQGRPIIGADERCAMLGALECVDYVTVFDEDTPVELLKSLQPNILAKGGTTAIVVGRELVESYGGQVLTLDQIDGFSTTNIIERILAAESKSQE